MLGLSFRSVQRLQGLGGGAAGSLVGHDPASGKLGLVAQLLMVVQRQGIGADHGTRARKGRFGYGNLKDPQEIRQKMRLMLDASRYYFSPGSRRD